MMFLLLFLVLLMSVTFESSVNYKVETERDSALAFAAYTKLGVISDLFLRSNKGNNEFIENENAVFVFKRYVTKMAVILSIWVK